MNTFAQVTDIPDTLIENHDIVVDYIVTPTKVIECEHRKKPSGIIWSKITREKLQQVPILKKLRKMEEEAGKDVTIRCGSRHLISLSVACVISA